MTIFSRFVKDESGATAIEYSLIAALMAAAIIAALTTSSRTSPRPSPTSATR